MQNKTVAANPLSRAVRNFIKLESSGGIVLLFVLGIVLIIANTPLDNYYRSWLQIPVYLRLGNFIIDKPLLLWINDGLMAVFFMLLSLEIKREFLAGELSNPAQVLLPCVAAIGGVLVPAVVYYLVVNPLGNYALRGWAIPTATDIALALGMLALLGKRVPVGLKIFLAVLAIFDDIIAIALIAIFYTENLSLISLLIAGLGILVMLLMNALNVMRISLYLIIGVIVWVAVLKSGVHATLAGVVIGFCIPFKNKQEPDYSPLRTLEHKLHPWVAFFILPLFVLANAGVPFVDITLDAILHPVPLGIMLGLFIGKQVGIFGFSWLVVKIGWAKLPVNSNWLQIYGVAILAGIGFTMSLFISTLAFNGSTLEITSRGGIFTGFFCFGCFWIINFMVTIPA